MAYFERLFEERKRLKLTQSDIASAIDQAKLSVVNYESGKRDLKVNNLIKLAGLGFDINYILTGHRAVVNELKDESKRSEELGLKILNVRKKLGLNQIDLAKKMKVSRNTQFNYENGLTKPDSVYLSDLIIYAKDLGISSKYFFETEQETTKNIFADYKVIIFNLDGQKSAESTLPFVPVVGMWLQAPFEGHDYFQVESVYWDSLQSLFEVYLDTEAT